MIHVGFHDIKRASGFITLGLLATLAVGAGSLSAQEPASKPVDGLFITVPNPITDAAVQQIKRKVEDAKAKKRNIDIIVFDFNPNGLPAGTKENFGSCHDLAKYIRRDLDKIKTFAFVHNKVTSHTVLPVLACGQIVMSKEKDRETGQYKARLGDVKVDAGDETARNAYEVVAKRYSKGLVFRMIDHKLVVKKVLLPKGVSYLSDDEIEERRGKGERPIVEANIPRGLEAGNTTYDWTARDFGLVSRETYSTRVDLARALRLPPRSLNEDWLVGRTPVIWRIEVRGTLNAGKIESLRRRLKNAIGKNANLIILQLDCETGDTADAATMARELRLLTDDSKLPVKTIAYIPADRALGAATFLALGCNDIAMGKNSYLGDFRYLPEKTADALREKREMLVPLAKDAGYPPALFEAMLKPGMVLYRMQSIKDPGDYQVMTEEQWQKENKAAAPMWKNDGTIHSGEGLFQLEAHQAKEFGVAQYDDVESPEALYTLYGLDPAKVRVARDDWLDKVAEFFRDPIVNVILIMLGIVGLILELKMPGVTLPGILSAVCFVLFFWAYSFESQFTMLAVLLFVLGLILIGLEIFVLPGFGITGISGIVLIIVSLALVTLEKMPETSGDWLDLGARLSTFGISLVAAIAGAFMLAWYLPHIPYANRLVLLPPSEEKADTHPEETSARAALLGAIGVAETTLRPAGKARFGDDFLDVVAEGDYVNPGSRVQVIEIEGNRIVVKAV
jgi:membrane-bound ClpP family serine protease